MNSSQKESSQNTPPQFGTIYEVHASKARVKVDFHGNPIGQPVWAAIGRAFKKSDLDLAIDNRLTCKINFMDGDLNLPILVDIFTSLLDEDLLIFRAKKMQIQGEEEVVIRSGETRTTMTAKNGSVKTAATHIYSTAEKMQKIQAAKITLN
ncbi:hypothetical protein [Vibrio intestinalis]|uniref:hypothetical protein n=1 Tax=Vibrio intestinalis TaxID=2933291 RepID=UPI0021A532C5|nr:hypothetical protein [Vibrio intestinalis]